MSATNKELVTRDWFQEIWDNGKVAAADDLLTVDYRLHLPGSPAPLDREATKQVITMFTQAFADMQHTMDEVIAEGDAVVARWTVHSTHRGEFQGIAPTNKPVRMSGITVHHISNGRIAETWLVFDTMALLQQLGAVPGPAQA